MYDIIIKENSKNNWKEALEITIFETQKTFVPNIIESLAFAYIKPWDEAFDPYVLYDNNRIIGAFYISYTPNSEDNYWIGGFQISKEYQGKGYGKQSLHKIIDFIKEKHPECKVISLTVEKENIHAITLYEKLGFISQESVNDEQEAIYKFTIG